MARKDKRGGTNREYSLNVVEKAISFVSPAAAQKRFEDRIRLTEFESQASKSGLRGSSGGMSRNSAPETHKTSRDRMELMWDARDLEKRSPLIAGVLSRLTQYVVGRLAYTADTGNEELDKKYTRYFKDWCKRADYTGRMHFREMIEMVFRSAIRDGDHGLKIVDDPDDLSRISLQCIEADRIGSPHETRMDDEYISGLHIKKGKVIAFDIYKRTTTAQYIKEATVPSSHFIHYHKNRRADEYRGRTPLEAALPSARDLLEIFGFEKQAQKFASSWAAFITTNDPAGNTGSFKWDKTDPVTGWSQVDAMPGKVLRVKPGEGIDFAQGVARPNQAFLNLVELTIQMIALCLDLPFGFVFDMSKFGGVTARIETQLAKRTIHGFQRALRTEVLDRVRDEVFRRAIIAQKLPATPRWNEGTWHFGAHITSDIQYQTSADLQLISAGLKSPQEWCEENDVDFARTQESLAIAAKRRIEIAASNEMPVEVAFPSMSGVTEMMASFAAKDDPPEDNGMIGEVGESGIRPLMQIVEQYNAGAIDRDSAIMQLTEIYGFDPDKASMFFPPKPTAPVSSE